MPFEFLHRDADRLLNQKGLSVSATWSGGTLSGVRTSMKRQDAATISGDQVNYDFSLLIPSSQLRGALPQPLRDVLSIDGQAHLLLAIEYDVAGNVRLHLGSRYG